jgi:hypothetical protein
MSSKIKGSKNGDSIKPNNLTDEFLNSLLTQQQTSGVMKGVNSQKQHSRQASGNQSNGVSFDVASRNNIEKAMHAYNITNKKDALAHKRSQS